jgi:hypothetical protein
LQSLCELKTDEAIRERVGRLPAKLEVLYDELHEKISKYQSKTDRRIARNILSWLLCAQRRLKSREFLAAVAMSPTGRSSQVTKDQALDLCCNLIIFDATLDTFRYSHLSVREFLESREEYNSTAINALAAESCLLGLISFDFSPAVKMFLSQYELHAVGEKAVLKDFISYSSIHWASHCQLAAVRRTEGVLKILFLFFIRDESDQTLPFACWASRLPQMLREMLRQGYYLTQHRLTVTMSEVMATSAMLIFLACSFDFPEVIRDRVTRGGFHSNYYINGGGLTALHVAVKHGSRGY